jgi:hypothetical protein
MVSCGWGGSIKLAALACVGLERDSLYVIYEA